MEYFIQWQFFVKVVISDILRFVAEMILLQLKYYLLWLRYFICGFYAFQKYIPILLFRFFEPV